jgi:hypothetical protein
MLFEDRKIDAYFLREFLPEYDELFFGAVNWRSSKQRISVLLIACEEKNSCWYIQFTKTKTIGIDQIE